MNLIKKYFSLYRSWFYMLRKNLNSYRPLDCML